MGYLGVAWGYGAGTEVGRLDDLREQALWARSAGFDSFWLSQVFGVDPIVALSAIAEEVRGFTEVGTSVVPLTGRHPLALAAAALTAQAAANGRFTLGVGPSHPLVAEGMFGESYDRPYTRTREFVEALESLVQTGSATVKGEEVFASGWLTIDAPPVPILLAALGPRMLRLAGEQTAGTSLGSCGPKTIKQHIVPILNHAAERARRPKPRVMALVGVGVTDQRERRREQSRVRSAIYDQLPSYRAALDREGVSSGADLLLLGSPDEIEDGLLRYVEAGVPTSGSTCMARMTTSAKPPGRSSRGSCAPDGAEADSPSGCSVHRVFSAHVAARPHPCIRR